LQAVGIRHRELALQAAARHFAFSPDEAFPLVEGTHAALMGLLLRRNVQGDDGVADLVLKMLEDMIILRLPAPSTRALSASSPSPQPE
jgi:hypothetical protein